MTTESKRSKTTTTHKVKESDEPVVSDPSEVEAEAPELTAVGEDERGASDPVRVSLLSPFAGSRFRIPYEDAENEDDALVIDQGGVLVERNAVPVILEAATRAGVSVKVEDEQ